MKDMMSNPNSEFGRLDSKFYNATIIAKVTVPFANYTSVSSTEFLGDIYSYLINTNGGSFKVVRVDNTFCLTSGGYPQYAYTVYTVYCTP
jgi:hypothetical protein